MTLQFGYLPQRRYSEARELAFKSWPVSSIANWPSPVLLVHGDDDRNVPFQQTTELGKYENFAHYNVSVEMLHFNGSESSAPQTKFTTCFAGTIGSAPRATAEFFDRKLAAPGERQ